MRLTDLDPRWVAFMHYGNNTVVGARVGLTFLCPCCRRQYIGAMFAQPIGVNFDAAQMTHWPPVGTRVWQREGDSFDTLTLNPSIDVSAYGHWHGHIRNGEVL